MSDRSRRGTLPPDRSARAATLESDLFTVIEGTAASISFDPAVPPVPRLAIDLTVDEVTATQASGTVICNREASFGVEIIVEQTRGGSTASAFGFSFEGVACDTTATTWSVSLRPGRRRLVGGPATYEAFAFAEDGFGGASDQTSGQIKVAGRQSQGGGEQRPRRVHVDRHRRGPGDFFFDYASATDRVKLRGTVPSTITPPPPNPGSRITITTATRTSISGVVVCEEPVTVGLEAELSQTKGRSTIRDGGFDEIDCDGETPFTIDLEDGAISGRATAVVSGFAFRIVERPEDPFPIFEEVWTDYQSASVKLSGRR